MLGAHHDLVSHVVRRSVEFTNQAAPSFSNEHGDFPYNVEWPMWSKIMLTATFVFFGLLLSSVRLTTYKALHPEHEKLT